MPSYVSSIWRSLPADLILQVERVIDSVIQESTEAEACRIFFRADDVAAPGERFVRMMELFSKYGIPLSLAVVPAWLTRVRWQYLKGFEKKGGRPCVIHQY